jgi:hypothetical protein
LYDVEGMFYGKKIYGTANIKNIFVLFGSCFTFFVLRLRRMRNSR